MSSSTIVYTDGACKGNPGPGGWGWIVPDGPSGNGGEVETTNQRMELAAVLEALRALPGPVEVVSDSTYVVNCFRDRWYEGWMRRGWVNSQKKPVANRDLWEPLIEHYLERAEEVTFRWVKGHAGDRWNEAADELAVAAAEQIVGGGRPRAADAGVADEPADRPTPPGPARPAGHLLLVVGHQPPELGGYGENPVAKAVRADLAAIIAAKRAMHDDLVVVTGLRLGAEQLGAEAAIEAGVPVVGVLPYPEPDRVWPQASRDRFARLCEAAREIVTLERKRPDGKAKAIAALKRRDAWLARTADEAILVRRADDRSLGALAKRLEADLGDDVWNLEPPD